MKTINWALALLAGGLGSSFALANESTDAQGRQCNVIVDVKKAAHGAAASKLVVDDDGLLVLDEEVHRDLIAVQKGAWLGVGTGSPPPAVRKQLGLMPGMGLMVEAVVPDSPAAKAGIQQFDILQKLDDQILINSQQLAVLVRSHKVGDEIKLTVIHEGKPQTVTAKLVEHELEPLENEGHNEWTPILPGVPAPRVPPVPRKFPEHDGANTATASAMAMTWCENGQAYTLTMNGDGHKTFSQHDADGKTIFEVPIETREQRERLTPEQKEKLKTMESKMPPEARKVFEEPDKPTTQPSEKK